MQRSYSPQRVPPSRRRRSNEYFRLQALPVELRLLVLEFSLPIVNDVSMHWPAPIPALLRTSKQFNADTREVMRKWSPIHYIPEPSYLYSIPFPGVVKVETICLSMFHNARISVLRSGPYSTTPSDDHHDLVLAWLNSVSQLPRFDSVQCITIDATPAPGWLRYDKPSWLPNLLNDKPVADRFIYEHIGPITELMLTIAGFYQSINHPAVTVDLAGLYGHRSRAFPDYVSRRCARNSLTVAFTGTIIPEPQHDSTSTMTIPMAISELYSSRSIPPERYQRFKSEINSDRRRLLSYTWSSTSSFLFQNCFDDDEHWTMHQLERLTDLVLDEDGGGSSSTDQRSSSRRYIDVQIPDFSRGSLVCSLAKDLGLATTPRSSWKRKEIRVFRRSEQRWSSSAAAGRTRNVGSKSSESLFSVFLMSAAVVLFVGILSSDLRRRRGGGV